MLACVRYALREPSSMHRLNPVRTALRAASKIRAMQQAASRATLGTFRRSRRRHRARNTRSASWASSRRSRQTSHTTVFARHVRRVSIRTRALQRAARRARRATAVLATSVVARLLACVRYALREPSSMHRRNRARRVHQGSFRMRAMQPAASRASHVTAALATSAVAHLLACVRFAVRAMRSTLLNRHACHAQQANIRMVRMH